MIIIAGFSRSHLLATIGSLSERKVNVFGVSAIAPKRNFLRLGKYYIFGSDRLEYRRQLMGDAPVKQVRLAEFLFQVAVRISNPNSNVCYKLLSGISFRLFSQAAYSYSRKIDANYEATLLIRSGFGSAFGLDCRKFVSDASLPHPNVLQSLIETGEMHFKEIDPNDKISRLILEDTNRADVLLVNSDFVKKTFVFAGVNEKKIVVAYLPPTGHFKNVINLPKKEIRPTSRSFRILFAGTLEERKGVTEILKVAEMALHASLNFEFIFIGRWGKETNHLEAKLKCLINCRVESWKSQANLARAMEHSDVFLFPSRAEGGARVVTEAMCIGMPIITTHNSGTPINHLLEGIIVKPLDHDSIYYWLNRLYTDVSLRKKLASSSKNKIKKMIKEDLYLKTILEICCNTK